MDNRPCKLSIPDDSLHSRRDIHIVAARWQLRVMMVYTRNDVIQEIVPFVLQVNANAFLANIDRADFLTMIVLAKLENVFAINCSDVVAFALCLSGLSRAALSTSFSILTKCAQWFRVKVTL